MNANPGRPAVRVFDGIDGVARFAADTLAAVTGCAKSDGRRAAVALSGGSTPRRLFDLLRINYREKIPWIFLEIFFGDERGVPPDHPDSNYRLARRTLLDAVPIPREQVHRMPAEEADLNAAAARYEQEVRARVAANRDRIPVFDLIWLGLGEDGHTASLFPGTTALQERRRLVSVVESPRLRPRRLTFTYPLLNAARRVQFLVAGAGKAPAVKRILGRGSGAPGAGAALPPLPAAGVDPVEGVLEWLLDLEAAAGLDG